MFSRRRAGESAIVITRRDTPARDVERNRNFLVSEVARGSKSAFDALYDAFAPTIYSLARSVTCDAHIAEEVTQDVLVSVWSQAPNFDPSKGNATSWIMMITHRRAVDRVRAEQTRRTRGYEISSGIADSTVVTGQIEVDETCREIATMLGRLTEVQQQAIRLAYYDGLTHNEIAARLHTPLGTIKSRIRDGLIVLRDHEIGVARRQPCVGP